MLSTDISKSNLRPYNSMQMSIHVLLTRGPLMAKTLHRSRIRCSALSVIDAYPFFSQSKSFFHSLNRSSSLLLSHLSLSHSLPLSFSLSLYLCQSLSASTTQSRTPVIILTIADFCRRHQHQSFNQPSLKFKSAFPPFFEISRHFLKISRHFLKISRHFLPFLPCLNFPAIFTTK